MIHDATQKDYPATPTLWGDEQRQELLVAEDVAPAVVWPNTIYGTCKDRLGIDIDARFEFDNEYWMYFPTALRLDSRDTTWTTFSEEQWNKIALQQLHIDCEATMRYLNR